MANSNGLKLDLRSAPDTRAKLIKRFVPVSWCGAIISLALALITLPPLKIFFNYCLNLNLPTGHSPLLFKINFIFIAATFLVSITGVIINSTRNRRRSDHFNVSLIAISILSGISVIIWLALI